MGPASPEEAYVGSPVAAHKDGGEIVIDIPGGKLDSRLPEDEIKKRLQGFQPVERPVPTGFMRPYLRCVGSAAKSAVLK